MNKKIVFLTGTRADFGKLKSLIKITQESEHFDVHVFVTGMHMLSQYGKTINEIYKSGLKNIYPFINHDNVDNMDRTLAKTIEGFSLYVQEIKPDMIVIHGDRLEALSGAIVGSFNNILVSHIEGGEVSGTIDESIRHSVSKLCHFHFVANNKAKSRLVQMGEVKDNIFIIGSPDLDIIMKNTFDVDFIKDYYGITFKNYAVSIFHPVTTEFELIEEQSREYCKALVESKRNYVVIFPNNDYGSDIILNNIKKYFKTPNFRIYPSIRFEYFSILLRNADFIIGNSSTGIREAPYYPTKSINIGNRQQDRMIDSSTTISIENKFETILETINNLETLIEKKKENKIELYGQGNSDQEFLEILENESLWKINTQKKFMDIDYV